MGERGNRAEQKGELSWRSKSGTQGRGLMNDTRSSSVIRYHSVSLGGAMMRRGHFVRPGRVQCTLHITPGATESLRKDVSMVDNG